MEKTTPTLNTYKVVTLLFLSLFSIQAFAQKAGLYTFDIDCPDSTGKVGYGVLEVFESGSEIHFYLDAGNCNRICIPTVEEAKLEMINDSIGKYAFVADDGKKENTLTFKFRKDNVVITDNNTTHNDMCFFNGVYTRTIKVNRLNGVWQNTKSPNTYEKWTFSDERILLGKGYKIVNEKEVLTEELRLIKEDENWYYEATVSHNPAPVKFKLTSQEENAWIFENPEHDFPQKIVYEWLSDTELKVLVVGGRRGFTINFKKVE